MCEDNFFEEEELPERPPFFGCSFCLRKEEEVKHLIDGPAVKICDECVEKCNEILKEKRR